MKGTNRMRAGFDIRVFDADKASSGEASDYHELIVASNTDLSDEPPPDYEASLGRLKSPAPGFGSFLQWAAYSDGRIIGFENVLLPDQERANLAIAQIIVHPTYRRRGVATEMLRTALPELRARSRTSIEAWSVLQGGSGEQFSVGLGFKQVHVTVRQRLVFDEVDASLWNIDAPVGYRMISWTDSVPEELVTSYAAARNAMQDAPLGESDYREPRFTVERIRQAELEMRTRGIEQRVVAAVHESHGEIAGYTEVAILPYRPDTAMQRGTAISPAHRGHGLGQYIKVEMARWLRSDRPELRRVYTSTAASNSHMIRVNHLMGYVTTRTMLVLSCDVASLTERLDELVR